MTDIDCDFPSKQSLVEQVNSSLSISLSPSYITEKEGNERQSVWISGPVYRPTFAVNTKQEKLNAFGGIYTIEVDISSLLSSSLSLYSSLKHVSVHVIDTTQASNDEKPTWLFSSHHTSSGEWVSVSPSVLLSRTSIPKQSDRVELSTLNVGGRVWIVAVERHSLFDEVSITNSKFLAFLILTSLLIISFIAYCAYVGLWIRDQMLSNNEAVSRMGTEKEAAEHANTAKSEYLSFLCHEVSGCFSHCLFLSFIHFFSFFFLSLSLPLPFIQYCISPFTLSLFSLSRDPHHSPASHSLIPIFQI